jgi:hypothetical protein
MGFFDWLSDPWPEESSWRRRRFNRYNADAADARADTNIGAQMLWGHRRKKQEREPLPDIERQPRPGERPHDRAQWDEVRGRWVEWDEVDDEWDDVGVTDDGPEASGPT